jgi:hypothetical protein
MKAAVLPVPVWAMPMTSARPEYGEMASEWGRGGILLDWMPAERRLIQVEPIETLTCSFYVEPSRTPSSTSTKIGSPMLPIIEKTGPGIRPRSRVRIVPRILLIVQPQFRGP